jgi:DNA-binding NarL/FixJ family response regulator
VLTAFEDPDHLAEAIKAGAAGYVLKSAPPARIVEAVRKVLLGDAARPGGVRAVADAPAGTKPRRRSCDAGDEALA